MLFKCLQSRENVVNSTPVFLKFALLVFCAALILRYALPALNFFFFPDDGFSEPRNSKCNVSQLHLFDLRLSNMIKREVS